MPVRLPGPLVVSDPSSAGLVVRQRSGWVGGAEELEALDREAEPEDAAEGAVKFGQSRPSSKLRIVPVTTPTANSVIITFDQRRANRV